MNKIFNGFYIVLIVFLFIIFHSSIINLIANINTLFNHDNRYIMLEKTYNDRIDNLKREISEYEKQSNLSISKDESLILSKVALRNIYDFYDYLIINTSRVVEPKKAVINENGLVGIVKSNEKTNAKVSLITGENKISVKVNQSYGLLGEYNKHTKLFKINNINNYNMIKKGDIVTTSGLSDIPEGIYVGKVEKINKKGIKQVVYVKSQVDFDNLNYLYVLK